MSDCADPTSRIGQILGHYRLTRFIGHGGFAEVYLGEHIYLGTEAAIKLLTTRLSEEETAHFQHEARVIAQLEHSYIVRVLDFGIEEQLPFLVMSYAPHGSLRQYYPRNTRLTLETVISYIKQIASALQYAHDRHLIHRDVKPENILLGRNGEALLSDFGLAVVAQSTSRSHPHDVSGTVAYMAPEQARGHPNIASDQYALAIIAYEWLCGQRPFNGTYEEVVVQHAFARPPSLCEQVPSLTPAIEAIIMRALEKDLRLRFSSVHDFAHSLEETYLAERGITTTTTTTAGTPASIYLPPTQVQSNPEQCSSEAGRGKNQSNAPSGSQETTYAIAWSPDSRKIAFGGQDRSIQVRGTTTGASTLIYREHTGSVTAIAWSPTGNLIASAALDRTIHVWNAVTGQRIATYEGHKGMISALAWSPDGRMIASACSGNDTSIHIWYATTGQETLVYNGHTHWVRALAWSPNGKVIASGSWQEIQIWDSEQGRKHFAYRGQHSWVRAIAWSPHVTLLASAGEDNCVQLWEPLNKGHVVAQYHGHNDWVTHLRWSPDGQRIASGSRNHSVHIWEVENTSQSTQYRVRSNTVYALSWLPDSKHLACASGNGALQVWQARNTP
jgi:Serine/threonine protein kinase